MTGESSSEISLVRITFTESKISLNLFLTVVMLEEKANTFLNSDAVGLPGFSPSFNIAINILTLKGDIITLPFCDALNCCTI